MGQGTSPPPVAPAAPATGAPNASSLSDNQLKAITMLMSQLGKGGSAVPAGSQQQIPPGMQTQTMQGGTVFNPNQQR
jgi:3-oxoacyl-ACP reductase-like protein